MGSLTQLTGLRECDVAVDLGTTNTLIHARGRGIVLAQPSIVAVKPRTSDVRAIGIDAERLLEREADSLSGVRPLRRGVINDFDLAVQMLRRFSRVASRRRRAHPRMVVVVPSGATGVARRAVRNACRSAGAGDTHLIEAPLAAAIGAGLPVGEAVGSLVVDIGGGVTEVALISLGGVVTCRSIPIGGDELDQAIIKHLKREHGLLISQRAAEEVKRRIGSALPAREHAHAGVSGQDPCSALPAREHAHAEVSGQDPCSALPLREHAHTEVSGQDPCSASPRTALVTSEEIHAAVEKPVRRIVEVVKETLGRTPPELSSDVLERGAVLTGGGALLKGLDERLRRETQMPAQVAELPLTCVVTGAAAWLEELNDGRFQEVGEPWRYDKQVSLGY
jgi:rod shape-determining protein MreB and related proteins